MDPTLGFLIETLGPTGAVIGVSLIIFRTILPWFKEYLQSQAATTSRIADAVEKMEGWQHSVNLRLDRIERLTDGVSRDMTGVYAYLQKPQPSEQQRRANQQARGPEGQR